VTLLEMMWSMALAAILGYWLGLTLERAKRARQIRTIKEAREACARYLSETASEHYLRGSRFR
jgi:hypothetical protein